MNRSVGSLIDTARGDELGIQKFVAYSLIRLCRPEDHLNEDRDEPAEAEPKQPRRQRTPGNAEPKSRPRWVRAEILSYLNLK